MLFLKVHGSGGIPAFPANPFQYGPRRLHPPTPCHKMLRESLAFLWEASPIPDRKEGNHSRLVFQAYSLGWGLEQPALLGSRGSSGPLQPTPCRDPMGWVEGA